MNDMTQKVTHISLAQGKYSDYQNCPFRVLKPFTLRQCVQEFRAQDEGNPWSEASRFIAWMAKAGYVEDDSMPEFNVEYDMDSSDEILDLQFAPEEDLTPTRE